jgi:O-methyltransferase involved in polyketide biosynthesis
VKRAKEGDLSVTALYTSAAWAWGKLPNAELFASKEGERVFHVVNAVMALARPFFARLPPLAKSLLHRHAMIDHLLTASRCTQVLELAAGLSRRGVTFSTDPKMRYVEVDLPNVVDKKRALLSRSSDGRDALARSNWSLVPADVSTMALADVVPPARELPLFVIAEGLLMYFDAAAQGALFRAVAERLAEGGGGTLVFDLVPPNEQPRPGAIGRMLAWLMKRFTGGKGFVRDDRTREDIRAELVASGFSEVEILEPQAVAESWKLPFPTAPTQQVLFCSRLTKQPVKEN